MSNRLAFLLLVYATLSCGQLQLFEAVEPHMGTLVRIKLYARDADAANRAFRNAFVRIAALDQTLSDYKPASELNRICREAVGRRVRVSEDLFRVLEIAQVVGEKSDGAFDVTLGAVTHLWRAGWIPSAESVREALKHTGLRKLHLNSRDRTVEFDEAGMQLDAGGIGKGFAAEEALLVLREAGVRMAMVAIAGDLAIGDAPPASRGWKIAIAGEVRELRNCSVSTSGDAEQHVNAGGVRYSHILDPATGMGLTHSPTITVIAPHGAYADALSTAISVLGAERGGKLAAQFSQAQVIMH
jgi:thiamine biosynthesis lipoprotein